MGLVVLQPHYDDAVYSVGQIIAAHADVTVLTVFSGVPAGAGGVTDYDQACGFATSIDAMMARRQENDRALAALGAIPAGLGLFDQQYHSVGGNDPVKVGTALRTWFRDHHTAEVLAPLGLLHPDHKAVRAGVEMAVEALDIGRFSLYEELPYRVQWPTVAVHLAERLPAGTTEGHYVPGSVDAKRAAVECYTSQLTDEIRRMVYVPERVWRVRWRDG